jgi:hypothetical protein
MTGPSLAPIIIPIVGTLCLIAWLVVVFYAGQDAGADREPESSSGE